MSDHDREWIIGCIKHDGFIKTDRFDKANHIILDALQSTMSQERVNHESTNDLISRADVLKYPIRLDHYDEVNGSREFVYGVESVMEYVESLPSADAVQGEWRIGNTYRDGISRRLVTRLECSNCNSIIHRLVGEQFPNFCPSCGARMKGGAE